VRVVLVLLVGGGRVGVGDRLRGSAVAFARGVLGLVLFPYQAELLSCASKRIVACWARQTGKTTAIAVKVIHFAFTNADTTTLIVSRGLRQSMIMFGVIEHFVLGHPVLRKSVVRSTRTQILLRNGSQVSALPCGPDGAGLRGFTAHLVVMDEAAFMPEYVIASVVFPMLATTNGTAIMLSTPWGRDHVYYRSFKNPSYWSQHVKAEQCPRITNEFLEEQRRDIGELRYKMEYEAEFVEDENSFFKQDLIRECTEDYDLMMNRFLRQRRELVATVFWVLISENEWITVLLRCSGKKVMICSGLFFLSSFRLARRILMLLLTFSG